MKKTALFTTHKKASITIIVFLILSFISTHDVTCTSCLGEALRTEPAFVIGSILGQILLFFFLFGIYYFIRSMLIKIKGKKK